MRIVGLISGTSFDAIEAASAELTMSDEQLVLRPLGAAAVAYPDHVRARIAHALPPSASSAEELCKLDTLIGQAFADTARRSIEELADDRADLIVSHGQTLYHWVEGNRAAGTLQLGQPAWVAEATGLPVVADIRTRDVAAGGHGAPLASLFDALLLSGSRQVKAGLNLGGIANLTVVFPDRDPIAFDVGPANALVDAAITHYSGGREAYDADGRRAARGRVSPPLLETLLRDPFYDLPPPKSTGKEHFHVPYLLEALGGHADVEPDDVVATLTFLTAHTVARECRRRGVSEVVASGGGVGNRTMMKMLTGEMGETRLSTIDDWGIPSHAKEAYLMCVLGFLTYHGLPGTLPSCTGARRATLLGSIVPGTNPLRLPDPLTEPPRRLIIAP